MKLFHFSLPFLDRQRDQSAKRRGTKAKEWLRKEHTEVLKMKPCEVRCGNPSQYEAERGRTVTKGGVWRSKRICGQGKSERKTGNRTQKASKAIKQQNNFSRRVIKGIQHSHTLSQNPIPGKVFQPTHPFGHETHECYFTPLCFPSKKKMNTLYNLSNEQWLSLKM